VKNAMSIEKDKIEAIKKKLEVTRTDITSMPRSASIQLSPESLSWYEWLVSNGYEGTLSHFVNDIIHSYFVDYQKIQRAISKVT
jgi:hypothetical protein